MSTLRLGFIGAGTNTRKMHLPGFRALPGVSLDLVCNRSLESSQRAASEHNIPRVAERWQDVVADPALDAICIGTWPYLHADITVAALQAGKHVLTEARMARNVVEAEAMLEASRQAPGLVAQIVPGPFTLPWDAYLAHAVASGALGALREVCVIHTQAAFARADTPLSWRQDFYLSGYNTLALGIIHESVLRWLPEDPVWVLADAAIHTRERVEDSSGQTRPVKIPDSLTVLGRFPGGARLLYHLSGVESGQPRHEYRLHGAKRSLRLDLVAGQLWEAEAGQTAERLVEIPPEERGSWQVEADFVHSIREGRPVTRTDFPTGLRYMKFTEAVWRSWSGYGQKVPVG